MTTRNLSRTTFPLFTISPPTWAGVSLCDLLFDENLSRKLSARLSELYPGSAHVAEFDLLERSDREIWDFARKRGFVIVTADADFYELATVGGPPPKVVWLRRWSHPTRDVEFVLRRGAMRITEFACDPTLGILLLDR